jgi:ATP-binding cassette subfamily B protein
MSIFFVVFQDFNLLAFTLVQNVASRVEFDEDYAVSCLAKAGFNDRWSKMDTYLYKDFSDNGVEISSGEAQKIALARTLYKNSAFIILDEPTAALDPVAEYEVYTRFNKIVENKTAIFISHRLASCRFLY